MTFEIADFTISLTVDGVFITHTPSASTAQIAPATLAQLVTALRAYLLNR